ncbi:alpha/beta hydrolase family protein [Colwelliaceae bacterium 6471]
MIRLTTLLILFVLHFSVAAELLPVEAFGNLPQASQVKLSPDGKQMAFIRNINGFTVLGVTNLEKAKTKYIIKTDNQKFKISWYLWANNELILISADYPVQRNSVKFTETRLLKIKADGSDVASPTMIPKKRERIPQFQNNIIDMLPDDPNHILMALDLQIPNTPSVYKIDLASSRIRELVYRGKSDIYNWMTDRQHRLRLGFGRDDTKIFYRLFDMATQEWRNIWEYEIFDAPDITPLGFGLDPNDLYIRANHDGRYAIFKVDLRKKELPRVLIYADKNYDVEGALIYSKKTNDVIGVYHGEADDSKIFFEPSYAAFQKALNLAIPDAYNNISSMSADERKYILFSSSPKVPGAYYLGDRDNGGLQFVLEHYPMLYNQKLSGKDKISYKARDGLEIEGYVSLPYAGVAKTNAAIIIPHGGPMARNYGGFDWFSEFFASRGYTVLQPNFRGSSGYGFKFQMASIQQWGGAMQDDLEDAAHWLVDNYEIDKSKVCIVGASYGGYAALLAAVKQQKTFRCAASFAGVSDLEYIVRKARKFTNYKVVQKQIGSDSDKLEEYSPINFAEEINIPVMLIHGDKDRVVDVEHSRKMYEELLDHDKKAEYIELENGNHYLEIENNRVKTLTSFARFLDKNLK